MGKRTGCVQNLGNGLLSLSIGITADKHHLDMPTPERVLEDVRRKYYVIFQLMLPSK